MALLEDRSAAFIVRIWCEPDPGASPPLVWRGSVEHVASGRRVYVRDFVAIEAFIRPHVERLLDAGEPPPP